MQPKFSLAVLIAGICVLLAALVLTFSPMLWTDQPMKWGYPVPKGCAMQTSPTSPPIVTVHCPSWVSY